jgi:Uma2 family endonuclease
MTTTIAPTSKASTSLEDYLQNPPEGMEWIDGQLIEKTGMTIRHSRVQGRLVHYWTNYIESQQSGGEVYPEAPCSTHKQGRRADVAYITPEVIRSLPKLFLPLIVLKTFSPKRMNIWIQVLKKFGSSIQTIVGC